MNQDSRPPTEQTVPHPILQDRQHIWERVRDGVVSVMFLLTTYYGVGWGSDIAGGLPVMLVLSLLFIAWYGSRYTGWHRQRVANSGGMLRYYGLGLGIWLLLIQFDGAYIMYSFVFFATAFESLPLRWAIGLVLLVAVAAIARQAILVQSLLNPISIFLSLTAPIIILVTLYIRALTHQNEERARLIDELQATQDILAATERQAGVLQERQRLAHEIHDTLAQSFISIVTHLEAAESGLAPVNQSTRRHLSLAQESARISLVEARRLVQDLGPGELEQASLPEAIQRTVEEWAAVVGVDAQVQITGPTQPLATALETTLLRVTQEALNNVAKHAQASQVTVTLSYMGDAVTLDVNDNGLGFDVTAPRPAPDNWQSGGYGLQAMEERVTSLNGELSVESEPGEGTTVALVLPVSVDEIEKG